MKNISLIAKELKESYPYRVELHSHSSPASHCSDIPPRKLVRTYFEAGYSGVAITNHLHSDYDDQTSTSDYLKMLRNDLLDAEDEAKKLGMKVYRGMELRFDDTKDKDNDYLLFGYDIDDLERIHSYMNKNLRVFVEEYKTDDMIIIQAHPYRNNNNIIITETGLIDGIEAFNVHPNHNSRVGVASKYAEENNMLATCGTDYHHEGHHGLSAMRFSELPVDTNELIEKLRARDFIMEIGGRIVL